MRTLYKTDSSSRIVFAASIFITQIGMDIYTYLEIIRTHETVQKQRLACCFIDHVKEYIHTQLKQSKHYNGAFFIVAQPLNLKSQSYFEKHGFRALPQELSHLRLKDYELAAIEITGANEDSEESEGEKSAGLAASKKSLSKVAAKASGKAAKSVSAIDDDQQSVAHSKASGGTTKTKNGALDKHCTIQSCAYKRITGPHWSRHVKDHVDKGVPKEQVIPERCTGEGCTLCA